MDKQANKDLILIAEQVLQATKDEDFSLFNRNEVLDRVEKVIGRIEAFKDKSKNEELDKVIERINDAFKDKYEILDGYNGQIAALGVSILMTGLKPALAIYYQDAPEKGANKKNAAYRRYVLEVVARMLGKYNEKNQEEPLVSDGQRVFESAENLVRYVLGLENDAALKKAVIQCSVALKQVVRTYKLV